MPAQSRRDLPLTVRSDDGTVYRVRLIAALRPSGTWTGRLEFAPEQDGGEVLWTGQETVQPTHDAVVYWAIGLHRHYLEGALKRARERASWTPPEEPVLVAERAAPGFHALIWARWEPSGTWVAWIEFRPESGEGPDLRTGHETSQPSLAAIEYWAGGLQPSYFEGALQRSKP